jgi:hypothetical protein
MKVGTFTAAIHCGLKCRATGKIYPVADAEYVAQVYCDDVGLCVSVTPTTYVYTNGREPGVIIGLINYPRFPSARDEIRDHAIRLATMLKTQLGQLVVTVVFPDETVMLKTEPRER